MYVVVLQVTVKGLQSSFQLDLSHQLLRQTACRRSAAEISKDSLSVLLQASGKRLAGAA